MEVDNDDGKPVPAAADDSGSGGRGGSDVHHSKHTMNGDVQDLPPNPQQHHLPKRIDLRWAKLSCGHLPQVAELRY